MKNKIVLCSSSKVRAKLLNDANIPFIQKSCEFDEELIQTKNPLEFVKEATTGKFKACLECYRDEIPLLSADTIITDGEILLRKAKDEKDARKLLNIQSGNKIDIITYQIIGYQGKIYDNLATTTYYFDEFDKQDIENYIKSGEWMGSAGACKVENFCKKYIQKQIGYTSTAMGLTVEWVEKILKGKQ
jgi:septum formation protein